MNLPLGAVSNQLRTLYAGSTLQAAAVLHTLADVPGVPAYVRVTAASKVLDMAIKAHELQDVLSRLEVLERELQ